MSIALDPWLDVPHPTDEHDPWNGPPSKATPPPDLFRRWTTAELLDADVSFRWLVRGLVTDPTYGQSAGEAKTLKTHVTTFLNVAIATGQPLFDRFQVERPGPVLVYVGEGGRIPHTRLLQRVSRALGVDLRSAPIFPSYDVAPITSTRFTESLTRDLDEVRPVFFNLDPYYAFHGSSTDSRNLHDEGGLLTSVSAPCVAAGATCWITNHFNQTGSGSDLKRITQAGSTEWVDSWLLVGHREAPDVPMGRFRLRLEIGSRQWGGTSWDLDLDVGRFDDEVGNHDGEITWNLTRAHAGGGDNTRDRILGAVDARPGALAKEALAKEAGGNLKAARQMVENLESQGLIRVQLVEVTRSNGRTDRAWHYFPTSTPGRTETQDTP